MATKVATGACIVLVIVPFALGDEIEFTVLASSAQNPGPFGV